MYIYIYIRFKQKILKNPGFQGYPGYEEVQGYNAFGSNARSVNDLKYMLANLKGKFTSILKHYSNRQLKRIQ